MNKFKTLTFVSCALLMSLAGCSSSKKEIIVFAAASMTETMNTIKENYEKAHSNLKITYNFDSSGTLKTQIENGAACDLFISAAPKQMNQLDVDSGTEGAKDFIDHSTRLDLLENKVALAVRKEATDTVTSFTDLKDKLVNKEKGFVLAIGNSDVPVGQYTQKIFTYFGLNEEELNSAKLLTYGTNVKEVTTFVSQGTANCGIIYATDAYSANLKVVDTATKEMCGQVIYPAALLKNAPQKDLASEFLSYLQTEEAGKVFESVGFTPLSTTK